MTIGPTICPNANTIVKALMPCAQRGDGKLCRTKAVVDATADRNVAPNSTPDTNADERRVEKHRHHRGEREQAIEHRERLPAAHAIEEPRPQPRRYDRREPEYDIERRHRRRAHPAIAQQRDDERHVADIPDAEKEVSAKHARVARPCGTGGGRVWRGLRGRPERGLRARHVRCGARRRRRPPTATRKPPPARTTPTASHAIRLVC